MKIAVATPRCGPPSWRYHDSLVQWGIYWTQTHPEISIKLIHPERYLPIDVARNLLVRQFLNGDADYLWFLDQDAVFLPKTLDRLLSRRMPILSALEMMRLPGCCYPMALKGEHPAEKGQYNIQAPEVYQFAAQHYNCATNDPQMLDPPPQDSLLEVGFTGCHCLLIRRDVLEDWPEDVAWFQGYDPGGEDQWFCEQAFKRGITVYVDLSVVVGHAVTDRVIGLFDFMSGHRFLSEKKALEDRDEAAKMKEWLGA